MGWGRKEKETTALLLLCLSRQTDRQGRNRKVGLQNGRKVRSPEEKRR